MLEVKFFFLKYLTKIICFVFCFVFFKIFCCIILQIEDTRSDNEDNDDEDKFKSNIENDKNGYLVRSGSNEKIISNISNDANYNGHLVTNCTNRKSAKADDVTDSN